jgi:hypothetical protein
MIGGSLLRAGTLITAQRTGESVGRLVRWTLTALDNLSPHVVVLFTSGLVIAFSTLSPSRANCASALSLSSTHFSFNRRFLCAGYVSRRRFASRCSVAEFTLPLLSGLRLATWPKPLNGVETKRATTRHSAAS